MKDEWKIVVFSDSHGSIYPMEKAVYLEEPDIIFHLGDCVEDAEKLHEHYPNIPMYSVCGNCDYDCYGMPATDIAKVNGNVILYGHGHTWNVKSTYGLAICKALEAEAQILLFGHTHKQYCECIEGLWVMNPGSAGRDNYGVIFMQGDTICCYTM